LRTVLARGYEATREAAMAAFGKINDEAQCCTKLGGKPFLFLVGLFGHDAPRSRRVVASPGPASSSVGSGRSLLTSARPLRYPARTFRKVLSHQGRS
jgi:hypothetical protein